MTGYWRDIPCGHPPDPIAALDFDGHPVCHCGWRLNPEDGHSVESAPGRIVQCSGCGCHVAVPDESMRR